MNTPFDMPIILSDAVPEGMAFMLPPDVTKAMNTAMVTLESAFLAAATCLLAPVLFGQFWPVIADELRRIAKQKARALDFSMAGADLTITVAAKEKRIGCIKNIVLP